MRIWGSILGAGIFMGAAGAIALIGLRIEPLPRPSRPDLDWLARVPAQSPRVVAVSAFGSGPVRFEPNRGQSAPWVRWIHRGPGHVTLASDDGFTTVVTLPNDAPPLGETACASHAVGVRFAGARPGAPSRGEDRLHHVTNYFRGDDPAAWVLDVPSFGRVRYQEVWPGVDVVLHGRDGRLEYDFVVAPGADTDRIALSIEGAETVRLDGSGDLVLETGPVSVRHLRPAAFEETPSGPRRVPGSFVVEDGSRVRFVVERQDPELPLVIDPTVAVGRRLGGTFDDEAIVVSSRGGLVALGGRTFSTDFPGEGPLADGFRGSSDAFVTTLPQDALVTATSTLAVFGSLGNDAVTDLRIGPDGSVFAVGFTSSSASFPKVAPAQSAGLGLQDGFFVRLRPGAGSLAVAGPFGGTAVDLPTSLDLRVDPSTPTTTAAYVGVLTFSPQVPPVITNFGSGDPLVILFSPDGVPTAGINLGGTGDEVSKPVRVDVGPDDVAVSFATTSDGLPVRTGAYGTSRGGVIDGYLAVVDFQLVTVQQATYLSGSVELGFTGMDRTADGDVVLCGGISSGEIQPTANAFQSSPSGFVYGVVHVVNSTLTDAPFRSYVGADNVVDLTAVAVIGHGATSTAFISGLADTGLSPIGGGSSAYNGGPVDTFLLQLDVVTGTVPFLSHVGGTDAENGVFSAPPPASVFVGRSVDVDPATGIVYVSGYTTSDGPSFPEIPGAVGGGEDAFLFVPTSTVVLGGGGGGGGTDISLTGLAAKSGFLKDSAKAGKDKAKFSFTFTPTSTIPLFDTSASSTQTFALSLMDPAGPITSTAPLVDVNIDLVQSGWKAKKGGARVQFQSPRGETPTFKIVVDLSKGTGTVDVSRFDLPFTPPDGPALFDLVLGDASGAAETRLAERIGGKFLFVLPLTGLVTDFRVSPTTADLGDPFSLVAVIENHSVTSTSVFVRMEHQKFPFFAPSSPFSVPGRNPDTLQPGIRTIGTSVAPPEKGKGQVFELFVNDESAGRRKVRVR